MICGKDATRAYGARGAEERYCIDCGRVAPPERRTKGSFLLEFALWLLFFVPGLMYANWRVSKSYRACPSCGSTSVVLPDSSAARTAVACRAARGMVSQAS